MHVSTNKEKNEEFLFSEIYLEKKISFHFHNNFDVVHIFDLGKRDVRTRKIIWQSISCRNRSGKNDKIQGCENDK